MTRFCANPECRKPINGCFGFVVAGDFQKAIEGRLPQEDVRELCAWCVVAYERGLGAQGVRTEAKEVPCRFQERGCQGVAIARYALAEGCACFPDDREQDLCLQHVMKDGQIDGIRPLIVYRPKLFLTL